MVYLLWIINKNDFLNQHLTPSNGVLHKHIFCQTPVWLFQMRDFCHCNSTLRWRVFTFLPTVCELTLFYVRSIPVLFIAQGKKCVHRANSTAPERLYRSPVAAPSVSRVIFSSICTCLLHTVTFSDASNVSCANWALSGTQLLIGDVRCSV